jgi:hypothetical protein
LLRPELVSLIDLASEGLNLSSSLILDVITLLFVVYFGYFILIDAKFFLDLASARFSRKSRSELQNITYDATGLISLVLISALVTPLLNSIQEIGGTASKIFNIVLLGVGFFLLYHLANQIYSLVRHQVEKIFHESQTFQRSRKEKREQK